MLSERSTATPHPEVVCTELRSGETVLLHLGTHTYYTVNETGTRIWRLISEGLALDEIGHTLEAMYEVSPNDAQRSVMKLALDLFEAKLVSVNDEPVSGA